VDWCDLRLRRSRVQVSAVPLSATNLGQVVRTRVPLSPSIIIPAGKVTDRTSCIALAMRHRLQWLIHLQVLGLRSILPIFLMKYGTIHVLSNCFDPLYLKLPFNILFSFSTPFLPLNDCTVFIVVHVLLPNVVLRLLKSY